jgi:transposase
MIIIGCDFHPSFQQIAMLDTETGATEEHKLMHTSGEAESFYRKLASPAVVGIETVGNDQWFVQLLQKLGHEVRVGDAAQIRASYVRKQKTDRRDAKHILQLLVEGRVPAYLDTRRRDAGSSPIADASLGAFVQRQPGLRLSGWLYR